MKVILRFSCILGQILIFICVMSYTLLAVQAVTSTTAIPDGIAINAPTVVLILAQIADDPSLIRESVTLVRCDAQGDQLRLQGVSMMMAHTAMNRQAIIYFRLNCLLIKTHRPNSIIESLLLTKVKWLAFYRN